MSARTVAFLVPGLPTPWARPGARVAFGRAKHPGGRQPHWIQWYTDHDVDAFESHVAGCFAKACQLEPFEADQPLVVRVLVVEPRTKATMRQKDPQGLIPSVSPKDVDNYAKAVLDGLQRCGLCQRPTKATTAGCRCPGGAVPMLQDDKTVTSLMANKARAEIAHRASKRSAEPRLYVTVSELDEGLWLHWLQTHHPQAFTGADFW